MGQIDTFKAVRDLLAQENPDTIPTSMLHQYADLFVTYREAALNIAKNGAIVAHPKTGAPIENPYLKVRQQTMADLRKLARVKANNVWAVMSNEMGVCTLSNA